MVGRKFLVGIGLLTMVGCSPANSPSSQKFRTFETVEWKIRLPSKGWWFLQRGNSNETVVAGASLFNVGSRSMSLVVSQGCNSHPNPRGVPVGKGTVWLGGRVGTFEAFLNNTAEVYVAKVPHDKCTFTVVCEGDPIRGNYVESVCNSVINSVEFKK